MNEIKVSVVIPIFNAADTLKKCIQSIRSQTLNEIEIICVNDGSTDGSAELLESLAESDRRIKVINQENQHAGVARNTGCSAAKGTYVAFMDADDVYYSETVLERLYNIAKKSSANMVKGRFCYIDNNTKKITADDFSRNSSIGPLLSIRPNFYRMPERFVNAADVPWNGLYSRDFLTKNRIEFNNLVCVNDHSFYINCLLKAKKIRFVKIKTVLYTINRAGSLVSTKPLNFTSQLDSYNIVNQLCRGEPINVRRAVMRQELIGVFDLFGKLDPISQDELRSIFSEFLCSVDEEVIGEDFLRCFEWAEQYSLFRYGIKIERQKRSLIDQITACFREHGASYTFRRILNKLSGKESK